MKYITAFLVGGYTDNRGLNATISADEERGIHSTGDCSPKFRTHKRKVVGISVVETEPSIFDYIRPRAAVQENVALFSARFLAFGG